MPGKACGPIRQFYRDGLNATETEVMRLLERARQRLLARGVHCENYSCLAQTLSQVQAERERRRLARPKPGPLALVAPGAADLLLDMSYQTKKGIRHELAS